MDNANEPQSVWPEGETALVTLFRHNLWANLGLIDACATLDEAQLAATAVGTYGTIYDTPVSYTNLRAHETALDIVCRLLLEKKKQNNTHT